MAILAKCNEALQVLQFMAHDGCTVYAVGAVMYLQIVRFSAHAASVSVADADFALYFFPIGIMLQALPISARPALDVCCSCHSIPPFCVCFFRTVWSAVSLQHRETALVLSLSLPLIYRHSSQASPAGTAGNSYPSFSNAWRFVSPELNRSSRSCSGISCTDARRKCPFTHE